MIGRIYKPVRWSDGLGLYKDTCCFIMKDNVLLWEVKGGGSNWTDELAVHQQKVKRFTGGVSNTAIANF